MQARPRAWLDRTRTERASVTQRPDPADTREREFLRAAAVLWQFDLDALQPDSDEPLRSGEAASLLRPFVVRLRTGGPNRWTLDDALRQELLRGTDRAELARLRARNAIMD